MNEIILSACEEIDDAKLGCADLVFKDMCLEILAKAKQVLTTEQSEELSFQTAERINEKLIRRPGRKVRIQ